MKKKRIALALCAVLALALSLQAAAFTDVSSEKWYAPAVEYCEKNGLMDGFDGDIFLAENTVNRAQLVTTLWRLAGKPKTSGETGFVDVSEGVWYADAVRWARAAGITDGAADGRFNPGGTVSREQLATFFYRFAGCPAATGEAFADQAEISSWAVTAARWANGAGVMTGVGGGLFKPKKDTIRAVLAQTLMNYATGVGAGAIERELGVVCAPVGAVRGADGALYVTDSLNKAVWRLGDGAAERVAGAESSGNAGGYRDGPAAEALFRSPWGIAPFIGGLAISDPENNVVRLLKDGVVSTLSGAPVDYPTGLAADGSGGLFVSSTHSGEVWLLSPGGTATLVASGLSDPMGLCYAGGTLFIAETGAHRVVRLVDGEAKLIAGSGAEGEADGPAAQASFYAPQGVAVGSDGSVYIADTVGASLRCVRAGAVTTLLAPPDGLGEETYPASPVGLLVDGGRVYVCDQFARKLYSVAA